MKDAKGLLIPKGCSANSGDPDSLAEDGHTRTVHALLVYTKP